MIIANPIHILCFGDSLTAGFSQMGGLIHPYAGALKSSLEKAFPSANITTDVQGLSGDQVTSPPGGFLPRMDILYEETPTPYTYAIILGGTNDLAQSRIPKPIFSALQAVWAIPLSNNSKVLALTVPETSDSRPVLKERRDVLNSLILNYEAENFDTLDLKSKIPYWDMPEGKKKEIWDDGTHFTAKGYDLMGNIIADRIIELVSEIEGMKVVAMKTAGKKELKKRAVRKEAQAEGKVLRSGKMVVREVDALVN